jgi:hypothetical protein
MRLCPPVLPATYRQAVKAREITLAKPPGGITVVSMLDDESAPLFQIRHHGQVIGEAHSTTTVASAHTTVIVK